MPIFDPCNLRHSCFFDLYCVEHMFLPSKSPLCVTSPHQADLSIALRLSGDLGNVFRLQFHKRSAACLGVNFKATEIASAVLMTFRQGPEILMYCILQCTSDLGGHDPRWGRRVWPQDARFLLCGSTSDWWTLCPTDLNARAKSAVL